MKKLSIFLLCFILFSCNEAKKEMMDVHDEAMVVMSQNNRLKRSIKKIYGELSVDQQKQLSPIFAKMESAEKDMLDWMEDYKDPKADLSENEKDAFFKKEQAFMEKNLMDLQDAGKEATKWKKTYESSLPVLGYKKTVEGEEVDHAIPDFSFLNQDSLVITNKTFEENIYVADFFFTSCPSICPKVMKQMLRIHDAYKEEHLLKLVSFTMDPIRDDIQKLKQYSSNLEVDHDRWHFLTGDKDQLHDLADDHFNTVIEDSDAPGGFDHSGYIVLIDKQRHVRAFCNGTEPDEVTDFFKKIDQLIEEYAQ